MSSTSFAAFEITAPLLAQDHTREEFETALEVLLDRLDLALSQ